MATSNVIPQDDRSNGDDDIQLALIPLHPGGKKLQKLEAKPIPVVLGRTNLANWWWKSCDCGHYCRLHCRPVAQNIRSLSKVMVQIDSRGVVYTVGKNPHLVTVTPQREGTPVQLGDILSIGRRDREPWMKFQVIAAENTDRRPAKRARRSPPVAAAPPERQQPVDGSARRPTPIPDDNNDAAPQPPEWITTTTKKASSPASAANGTEQPAGNANLPESRDMHPNLHAQSNPNVHEQEATTRKRRRSRHGSGRRTKDSSMLSSKRPSRADKIGSVDVRNKSKPGMHLASSAPFSLTDKDHHPQVHLLFQDYETSATLVRATQRKKRRRSSHSQSISRSMDAQWQSRGTQQPERPFIASKNELQLLSQNYAAALRSASQTDNMEGPSAHGQVDALDDGKQLSETVQSVPGQRDNDRNSNAPADTGSHPNQENEKSAPGSSSMIMDGQQHVNNDRFEDKPADDQKPQAVAGVDTARARASEHRESGDVESDPPQSASATSENGSNDRAARHKGVSPTAGSPAFDKARSESDSDSSPELVDPIQDINTWKAIVAEEQMQGRESSFRCCLAKLVVTKNESRSPGANLWIPPLIASSMVSQNKANGGS